MLIPEHLEKALDQLTLDERRAVYLEACELMHHPDARFERLELSVEDRFVTYRSRNGETQTITVPVPSSLMLETAIAREGARRSRAGSLRETNLLDRLQKEILLKLVELLQA